MNQTEILKSERFSEVALSPLKDLKPILEILEIPAAPRSTCSRYQSCISAGPILSWCKNQRT